MSGASFPVTWRVCSTALVLIGLGLSGCQTTRPSDVTGSIRPGASAVMTESEARSALPQLAERYRSKPNDVDAAIRYAQALRATDQHAQAAAVLEQANINNPGRPALLAAYGRALNDTGAYQQAFEVLGRAHTPDNPDWRILSAQGTALDQLGRHDEARRYYTSALKIAPDEPAVLSNLGLSYALTKDLGAAEKTLRRAHEIGSKDGRVRQNLALVVGLQGRFAEAEQIARADLPPEEAAANVDYLRAMLSQRGKRQARARTTPPPFAQDE